MHYQVTVRVKRPNVCKTLRVLVGDLHAGCRAYGPAETRVVIKSASGSGVTFEFCCGLNFVLQNSHLEALTLNVMIFERAFEKVIKVRRGHKEGTLIH